MADALDLSTLSNEELAQWIIADRGYEFKLRTARYAADIMLIDGASFEETVNEVAGRLKIPLADAEKESKKYIAWTGLGAIYTSGYRKLEATNTKCVRDLLVDSEGEVITTWHEFDRKLERQKPRAEQ